MLLPALVGTRFPWTLNSQTADKQRQLNHVHPPNRPCYGFVNKNKAKWPKMLLPICNLWWCWFVHEKDKWKTGLHNLKKRKYAITVGTQHKFGIKTEVCCGMLQLHLVENGESGCVVPVPCGR